MPDTLITAAEKLEGVRVDTIRPHTGLLEAHRELELIDHVAAADGKMKQLQVLVDEAPRVLRVGWCTVVRLGESGPNASSAAPAPQKPRRPTTPWLPLDNAQALDGTADWVPQLWRDMDTTLAAAPLGDHRTAVVLGRPGGPQFRPSEVARLGYLAGIVATILH